MDPFVDADVVVLRENWDYHDDVAAFRAWLADLARQGKRVLNSPELVSWNLDKSYLLDLAARGVPVPRLRIVPNDTAAIAAVYDEFGWDHAVIKPTIGASGYEVELVPRYLLNGDRGDEHAWTRRTPVMVQEFMAEPGQTGEIACVFFDGTFSHAFHRRPTAGEFRVAGQDGGEVDPLRLPESIVRQATAVFDALDEVPLYARVDGVMRGATFVVMRMELIAPALMLMLDPAAPERFADATLRRITD